MKDRKSYLDLIRIIACFLVIYVHTASANVQTPISQVFNVLSRCNVPLFFMISGATLLGKNESIKDIWTKRIPRIVLLIIIFGVLGLIAQMNFDIKTYFKLIASNQVVYYWWYLFAYLAALICLPFLRAMAQNLKREGYVYLLVLHVVGALAWSVSIRLFEMPYNEFFQFPIVTEQYIFLMLMGYFIAGTVTVKELEKAVKSKYVYLLIIAIVTIISLVIDDAFVLNKLLAVCVFAFIRVIMEGKAIAGSRANHILAYLGNLTLGIYMIEPIITVHLRQWIDVRLTAVLPVSIVIISTFVATATSMIVTGVGVAIIKSIPGIKKVVGYII